MALDRQKILNELGSVMNQLKSTDCGCMGKLFGDSGSNVSPVGNASTCGYRHGCCHGHGYGPTSFGGSCTNNTQNMHRPCMGQCNPPKLYADTYNYLTENLMQPTINEVYNDLKTITPANTVMNNPMANQLGLSKEQIPSQNNVGSTAAQFHMGDKNTSDLNPNQIGQFGGMGPQIVNMFGESHPLKQSNVGHGQQLYPGSVNAQEYPNNTIGGTPGPHINEVASHNQTYQVDQSNNMNLNPRAQRQNVNPPSHQPNYHLHGQHAQGIAKFNEMFPGVMKNDLGFDPMSIAIQMNPANQKQVAMDTMHKIINNNNRFPNENENTTNGQRLVNVPSNINNMQQNQMGDSIAPKQDLLQQQPSSVQLSSNQPITNMNGSSHIQPNQQAYTALTSTPIVDQQNQQVLQQQLIDNTNSGPQSTPPIVNNGTTGLQSQEINKRVPVPEVQNAHMIKEPILPADKSRFAMSMPKQKYYEYNTLGQPVEMLPAKMFHTPEPGLPQTLSPEPARKSKNDFMKCSNVKSTMSKTSIMGMKPAGKTPSRNQLQHIYNNYKGSHSYTQQNVSPTRKNGTHSDKELNVQQETVISQQLERIGGDTIANNEGNYERIRKVENVIDQIGDAPVANIPEKESPVINRKYRNGLQDMTYTSYPTSAAWSFHGDGRASRPTGRYRNKI